MLLDLTSPEFWQTLAWPLFVLLLGMGWYPCCCEEAGCSHCNTIEETVIVELADVANGSCSTCADFNTTSFALERFSIEVDPCRWNSNYSGGPTIPCSLNIMLYAIRSDPKKELIINNAIEATLTEPVTSGDCEAAAMALDFTVSPVCDWSSASATATFSP